MLKSFSAEFLQHITNQNNWSRQHLLAYAGKIVQFNIALIKTRLLILEDGSLGVAPTMPAFIFHLVSLYASWQKTKPLRC